MEVDLSKNELQIMTVFWSADGPLTGAEIIKASEGKEWKERSLHSILNNLVEKGAIEINGSIRDGKVLSRTFVPKLSFVDYYEQIFVKCAPVELFQAMSAAMRKRPAFDSETADKISEILQELQEGLREKVDK